MNKFGKILSGVALGGVVGLSLSTTAFAAENPPTSPKKVEIQQRTQEKAKSISLKQKARTDKLTQKKKGTVKSDNLKNDKETDVFIFI